MTGRMQVGRAPGHGRSGQPGMGYWKAMVPPDFAGLCHVPAGRGTSRGSSTGGTPSRGCDTQSVTDLRIAGGADCE